MFVVAGWWFVAAARSARGWAGAAQTNSPIARLLAIGEVERRRCPSTGPAACCVNRLWPLLLSTILALGLGLVAPQVPGIATGFAIIGALAWRRQEAAVTAIEERDGVAFYVEPTAAR